MSGSYKRLLARADEFFASVVREQPANISCRQGCTMCCHGLFEIGAADVATIADGLRALDPATRQAIVDRASQIVDRTAHPDLRSASSEDKEAFFERSDMVPCPALDENGACLIYDSRPIVCRTFGLPISESGKYLGQECELNFTGATMEEKRSAAWDLGWEDVLGPEDEYTVPEAIVLASRLG